MTATCFPENQSLSVESISCSVNSISMVVGSAHSITIQIRPLFSNAADIRIDRNGLPIALIGREYDPTTGFLTLYLKTNREIKGSPIYIESRHDASICIPLEIHSNYPKHVGATNRKTSLELVGSRRYIEADYEFSADLSIEGFEINTGRSDVFAHIIYHQGNRLRVRYSVESPKSGMSIIEIRHRSIRDKAIVSQKLLLNTF